MKAADIKGNKRLIKDLYKWIANHELGIRKAKAKIHNHEDMIACHRRNIAFLEKEIKVHEN